MENIYDKKYSSSIHEDLVFHGDLGKTLEKVKVENDQLRSHIISLERDIQKLCGRVSDMKQIETSLAQNISDLYKTARNEIGRKDRTNTELQAKLDDLVFKRSKRQLDREDLSHNKSVKRLKNDGPDYDEKEVHDRTKHVHRKDRNTGTRQTEDRKDSQRSSRNIKEEEKKLNYKYDKKHRPTSRDRSFRREKQDNYQKKKNDMDSRDNQSREIKRNLRDPKERLKSEEPNEETKTSIEQRSPLEVMKVSSLKDDQRELDESKEEGEISDIEVEREAKHSNRGVGKSAKLSDSKISHEKVKEFDVTKFVEQQEAKNKLKTKNKKEANEITGSQATIPSKQEKFDKKKIKEVKTKNSQQNLKRDAGVNDGRQEKTITCVQGNSKGKNDKINIISDMVLNEVKVNPEQSSKTQIEGEVDKGVKEKKVKIEKMEIKKIPKVDKNIRESGVPRNLTGELNIELNKMDSGIEDKETDLTRKISSLFDTPMKNISQILENKFVLTHEGSIPKLDSSSDHDSKEAPSNQSIIEIQPTSTPVTEFQIFKSNLTCLEKSNSLTSIQFQTKGNVEIVNSEEVKTKLDILSTHGSEDKITADDASDVNNSDACNMSCLDLLNVNLAEYKVEDFPNLVARTESKDMPQLMTPVKSCQLNVSGGQGVENTTINISRNSEEIIRKVDVENGEVLNTSNNSDINNSVKRKRRRCTVRWAE